MTNYNERLDEILLKTTRATEDDIVNHINGDKSRDPYITKAEAKQAITSIYKELVAEAKPMVASKEVIETYLQNGMTQKAAEYHGRNHAINQFEQNLLKGLEE